MLSPRSLQIDLIKEMRLRAWARKNYVPVEERSVGWHSIVLQEMFRIDIELEQLGTRRDKRSRFVPLAPTPIEAVEPNPLVHQPHEETATPHMLQPRVGNDVPAEQLW